MAWDIHARPIADAKRVHFTIDGSIIEAPPHVVREGDTATALAPGGDPDQPWMWVVKLMGTATLSPHAVLAGEGLAWERVSKWTKAESEKIIRAADVVVLIEERVSESN